MSGRLRPLRSAVVGLAGLLAGLAICWAWWHGDSVQPYPFSHPEHLGMACEACHTGVEARASAGIPGGEVCARCHATSPLPGEGMERAWGGMVGGQARWNKLYQVPDHVYFSHRRHVILANTECAACHGVMADRATPPAHPLVEISMDRCISCHRKNSVTDDCAACHR